MSIPNDGPAPATAEPARSAPTAVVVIGAGPAGLTAAYELMKVGKADIVTILESDTVVGGISRPSSATAGASTSAATASSPR